MSLILDNCYKADLSVVEKVGCPPADGRWHPISHAHAINLTKEAIERAGLTVSDERYALSGNRKSGAGNTRMFGELILDSSSNLSLPDDFKMAIGVRNSIDKTISWNICGGENVMVCGNMLMIGDFMVRRKHTTNILDDLAPMADNAISNYLSGFENRVKEIEHWKQIEIDQGDVDHIVMECWRNGAFSPNQIPNIMHEWNEPRHHEFKDRTVWSLQNAFTEAHKVRPGDPNRNADASIIAHRTFQEMFPVAQAA